VADRVTAEARLDRVLHILPLAGRPGGATYDELAETLGVARDQVIRDVDEVTAREYYHPAGSANDIQIGLVRDRVTVWTGGHFQRPVRLTVREAAALHLGLRLIAAERDDPSLHDVLAHVEQRIAWAVPDEISQQVAVAGDPRGSDAVRALVVQAARERRRCRIEYLKSDAPAPESRALDPYVVVYSDGSWYAIGFCHARQEPRIFRIDRIMEAELLDDPFEPPAGFDPAAFLTGGRVFRADEEVAVQVRYTPRVARWLVERGEGEAGDDGSVVVTHHVADPGWLVRHLLQYGPDAEVLERVEMRGLVRGAAERVAAG
jgi:proteasome accessory factor C